MGLMEPIITINNDVTGAVDGMMGRSEFSDAMIDGNEFAFETTVNSPMGPLDMSYEDGVDGDKVTGNIANPMGGSAFSGSRKP